MALQHRDDSRDVVLPSIFQQFPDQFIDSSIFAKAREEGTVVKANERREINIDRNFTASDRSLEQRMAYFREDVSVNAHHWHWHLVYPSHGPHDVVNKDRRGELFYYMHHQVRIFNVFIYYVNKQFIYRMNF